MSFGGRCRQCGCIWVSATLGSIDICIICREEPEFGTPLRLSAILRVEAAALRAQMGYELNQSGAIRCLASGCTNQAREWWYVCSRECRDRLVKERETS